MTRLPHSLEPKIIYKPRPTLDNPDCRDACYIAAWRNYDDKGHCTFKSVVCSINKHGKLAAYTKTKKRYWTRIKIVWIFWFTWAGSIVSISNSPTFCRIKRQKKPTIMVGFLMVEDYSSTWYSNAGMTISTRRFCSRPAAVAFDAIGLLSLRLWPRYVQHQRLFSCSASDTA